MTNPNLGAAAVECDSSLINFNASLDIGIWAPSIDESTEMAAQVMEPQELFKVLEDNFWSYITEMKFEGKNLEIYSQHHFCDMVLCVTAILILIGKLEQAINFARKAIKRAKMIRNTLKY
jgi:hypothetical protein